MINWIKKHNIIILWMIASTSIGLAIILPKLNIVDYKKLKPAYGMTEAGMYYIAWSENPVGILVLAPTYNATHGQLIYDKAWQDFARNNQLAMVEIAFASEESDLHNGKGYYYVNKGSGNLLLSAIDKLWPENLPIMMYGFSGGAHFTSRFAAWKPERIAAWVAYSAGWWDEPLFNTINPPGIIICGENGDRFQATSEYYLQGIKLGKPWLWIGIMNSGHYVDSRILDFVRKYFNFRLTIDPSKTDDIKIEYGCFLNKELFDEIKTLSTVKPYYKNKAEEL